MATSLQVGDKKYYYGSKQALRFLKAGVIILRIHREHNLDYKPHRFMDRQGILLNDRLVYNSKRIGIS